MRKTVLLATASFMALYAIGASGAGALGAENSRIALPFKTLKSSNLLWNQNSNDTGNYVNSQNYSSTYTGYDDQAADDFVIPKGHTWRVTEVDVTGKYFNGSGPALSENVIFYKDKDGMPGKPVKNGTFNNLNGTGGSNFALVLPQKGIKLKAGHYWVSVIANEEYDPSGEWGWMVNSVQHEDQAMWQNPHRGFDICPTWGAVESCVDQGPDLMFDLRGASQGK
jgi:hypothetical protein